MSVRLFAKLGIVLGDESVELQGQQKYQTVHDLQIHGEGEGHGGLEWAHGGEGSSA